MVGRAISKSASFTEALGTPIKLRRFWIDFQIPRGPPPEYEQSGYDSCSINFRTKLTKISIEITAEEIAWTTRPISAKQYLRSKEIFQPRPILSAMWASWTTFWSSRWARIHTMITYGSKPEDLSTESPSISLNLQNLIKVRPNEDNQINSGMNDPPPEPDKDLSEAGRTKDQSQVSPNSKQSSNSDDLSPLRQDLNAALEDFSFNLSKDWKPPKLVPERGTVLAFGLIQLDGPRASCLLEVTALYDPQESRFRSSVGIKIRGMQGGV